MTDGDWLMQYLGRPWRAGADGPDAYDCWGCVRAIYRDHLGIALPVIDALSPRAVRRAFSAHHERAHWRAVAVPEPYAVALMSHNARPDHVGVWWAGGVVHAVQGAGVVYQRLASLRLHGWRVLELYARAA